MRGLKSNRSAPTALVVGLGPSCSQLSPSKVTDLQRAGELDVFAVNAFNSTSLASHLVPNFYVLTDPAVFGVESSNWSATSRVDPRSIWAYLEDHPDIRIIIPHNRDVPESIDPNRVAFVNGLGLQGFVRSIDPRRPRGYISLTSFTALAIAGSMNYSAIRIIGIENSQFRSLILSKSGKVALKAHHAYDEHESVANESPLFRESGVGAFFEDVSRLFGDLHLFAHLPISNLDVNTFIDAFPVADDCETFLEWDHGSP